MVPLIALLFTILAHAECPEDPLGAMRAHSAAVEQAFADLDDPGFAAAYASLVEVVPCVSTPLDLRDILALHRSYALAAFVEGDMAGSRKSWGAVRTLNPTWELPDELAPEGHLLRTQFDAAPLGPEVVELELAPDGGWLIDGRPAAVVPRDRAFVLQGADAERLIIYTGYHRALAEVPLLDFAKPGPSPRAKKMRLWGTVAGGGLALMAGGAAALHFDAVADLDTVDYDKFDATVLRGDVTGWSAIVLGAGAIGVTTVAWAVKW